MSSSWENVFVSQPHDVNFCRTCGSLLSAPEVGDTVQCWGCGSIIRMNDFGLRPVVTIINKHSEKEELEKKLKNSASGALIREECPKCGNPEMMFHTAQLRSADEGQTIFYECPKCGHKFTLNS